MLTYVLIFAIAFIVAVSATPLAKKISYLTGAVDVPNYRKIHEGAMPRLGGLAIVSGTVAGVVFWGPSLDYFWGIAGGAMLIVLLGLADDKYTLTAKAKIIVQTLAAFCIVMSGLMIELVSIPFYGQVELGVWSIPITMLWIVAITNAINLIDGLDGLAAGTSGIALFTIFLMAVMDGQILVIGLSLALLGATLGFLLFNFYPAKIFMGDTGAMFLGFSIAVISMLGLFKNVTIFSFVIPILILGIPIFDTLFAIIRRKLNNQKIYAPDRKHLHYCLLDMGFSHQHTVLMIYGMSALFGISAILFNATALWTSVLLVALLLVAIELGAERIGLLGSKKQPLLSIIRKVVGAIR
ncbi:undecaprenyl-phosphate alpha-N-acetylglucosaminyl 1-phosphate transferase [Alteribacter lacisalsi]|uniref:Undecaprenyl-phosphate alpha-N-acetylglucosaminyl 1-phosphate transferase n=1 Tax=Alteribacter lacisalsi TaxID=2045244 RepID=A0A2W0H6Y8_9BACI|nr:MraY family glycosyltransferase [Alteribacter lacisalsi]PYZ95870.1 undecaprenyl-phosphate alpha-N-acetylglucosaminyl 1-phosphate transferase [Alteribacter lacisalsi]